MARLTAPQIALMQGSAAIAEGAKFFIIGVFSELTQKTFVSCSVGLRPVVGVARPLTLSRYGSRAARAATSSLRRA